MPETPRRGETIRQFILDNVESHPADVSTLAAKVFGISRQAVNKHIQRLVKDEVLLLRGTTRNKHYLLRPIDKWEKAFAIDGLEEHIVWRNEISPRVADLPANVQEIWHYGFTEMVNNAIDHSSGTTVFIDLERTATSTQINIYDNGEGIFGKIRRELNLDDERHAVLELSKGKLTTDPANHTGEGIFFASRMFDDFTILSGTVYFSHKHDEVEDWILEGSKPQNGTTVVMKLANNAVRKSKEVFDEYAGPEDYGFTKTVVPVRLAQYGEEKLVSRSQAKRLLARVDRFKVVILDFDGVESIGQAFADEVFRVFKNQHPEIEILHHNETTAVSQMISRALSQGG